MDLPDFIERFMDVKLQPWQRDLIERLAALSPEQRMIVRRR